MAEPVRDFAELHVERWRDHWIDIEFDDDVEALFVRINEIRRFLKATTREALEGLGLQAFEYDTLHALMIRELPGRASPGDLARDLKVSPAGITGRLDGLVERGWVKRTPATDDRRRVDIEVTRAGAAVWREAMDARGAHEDDLATAISREELAELNALLKKLTVWIEERRGRG